MNWPASLAKGIVGPTVTPNLDGVTPAVLITIPLDRGDGTYMVNMVVPMHNQTDNKSAWYLQLDAGWRVTAGVAVPAGITSVPNFGGDDVAIANMEFSQDVVGLVGRVLVVTGAAGVNKVFKMHAENAYACFQDA